MTHLLFHKTPNLVSSEPGAAHVEFGNISGWFLSAIRNLVRRLGFELKKTKSESDSEAVAEIIKSLLRTCFYICALDIRVRSTYSICQIILTVHEIMKGRESDQAWEEIGQLIQSELVELTNIVGLKIDWSDHSDPVELYNLIICGAHFYKGDFVRNAGIFSLIQAIARSPKITYFGFITAKFSFLADGNSVGECSALNDVVFKKLIAPSTDVSRDSELFLFLSDYLASRDVSMADRRDVYEKTVGGQITNKSVVALETHVGFADLRGTHMVHLLKRKELRPVYS